MPLLDLRNVQSAPPTCTKPSCSTGSRTFHRHHRGHERFLLRQAKISHGDRAWLKEALARYEAFDPADVVVICDWHHEEVHQLYDKRLDLWIERRGCLFWQWTRQQILETMNDLAQLCRNWEKKPTPGRKPGTFVGRNP